MKQISYQGHSIQIFADLSPSTIQRKRALKPLLTILAQKDIKYWWTFPFAVKFHFKTKQYSFSNFQDGEKILLVLKLISLEVDMDTSNPAYNPAKRPTPTSPLTSLWNKLKTKRTKRTTTRHEAIRCPSNASFETFPHFAFFIFLL